MIPAPGNKKTSRDFLGSRLALLKVLCFLSGRQHIVFKLRRSALLRKEEAVSKGEIEKCASANHNLGLL